MHTHVPLNHIYCPFKCIWYKTYMRAHPLIQPWHAHKHTRTHGLYSISQCAFPCLPLMFLSETQLSSRGGQQMAQAAYSYLLLNIICFIHFAPQMHYCTWPHSQLSAETIQCSLLSWASNTNVLEEVPFIFLVSLHEHLKADNHVWPPFSLRRHPEVSWGVPGRGRVRRRVRVPGGRQRGGDQWLLIGAAHCQCPWGSGSRVLLQQVRCLSISQHTYLGVIARMFAQACISLSNK